MPASRKIPVVYQADVILAGGSVAAVSAAVAAARAGSRVFLAAAETYLGEDLCATGRLWLPDSTPHDSGIMRELLGDSNSSVNPVQPMQIKRRLDDALIAAGVTFLFGCVPADLLVDSAGAVAGVVFACRTGLFAVSGRVAADATLHAILARSAGVPFSAWPGGNIRFKRVVAGHRAETDDGTIGTCLPGLMRGETRGEISEVEAFEYETVLHVQDASPAAWAEAEQVFRDRTWHKDQIWSSARAWHVPPMFLDAGGLYDDKSANVPMDVLRTSRQGLFVLGPCAAFTREAAEQAMLAPEAVALGERFGVHAAEFVKKTRGLAKTCRPLNNKHSDTAIFELCTCERFERLASRSIKAPATYDLPVLGEYDVVVAGGGTGGAPAALAAASSGAHTLVLEALPGLGGTGTMGCIAWYYHGNCAGFTAEITKALSKLADSRDFHPSSWNSEHKSEWFRREIRAAGGNVWYGCMASGAIRDGRRVCGVVVNTPWGRGLIKAGVVVDATGNSDVAAAAGATCHVVSTTELAVQGTGLSARPFRPVSLNSDYTFIEDGDPVDVTRAFVVARRKFANAFDLIGLPGTRERRQIEGDATVTPLDIYAGRTWKDSICLSRSNFDSHGFTVHPLFFVEPPDRESLDAWLPLRALLPKKMDGILVTGLGISAQRDAMPVLRMQADIQNHAYAAGLAAAEAALNHAGDVRKLDIRALQRRLVQKHVIPQTALLHEDAKKPSKVTLSSAVAGGLNIHSELSVLMLNPNKAVPLLHDKLVGTKDADVQIRCARLLAVLGNAAGEDVLIRHVADAPDWDDGWNFTGMGQFGRCLSPLDDAIVCLGMLRSEKACNVVINKILLLDQNKAFSHFRAVSLYAESVRGNDLAAALASVLEKQGVSGHAWTRLADELADIPESPVDTRTRNQALRELYLARALYRCGDLNGHAARILADYSRDIRGHFARHAAHVLKIGAMQYSGK